jgi:hypothetical protein
MHQVHSPLFYVHSFGIRWVELTFSQGRISRKIVEHNLNMDGPSFVGKGLILVARIAVDRQRVIQLRVFKPVILEAHENDRIRQSVGG